MENQYCMDFESNTWVPCTPDSPIPQDNYSEAA